MHFPSLPRLSLVAALMLTGACSEGTSFGKGPEKVATAPEAPLLQRPAPRLSSHLGDTGFGQSVAIAVRSHPDVRASTADIYVAQAQLQSAQGGYRPAVSVGAQAQQSLRGRSGSGTVPYLRVSQVVYDGGAIRAERAAASSTVQQTYSSRLVTASTVSLDAVSAYLDVLTARRSLSLMQGNLARHREILELIEARRSAGAGGESDVLTARSRLANAETSVIEAQVDRDRAEARYLEVFGTPAPGAMPMPPQPPALPADIATAIETSPRMRALNASLAANEARLEEARAARRPRLELGANAEYEDGEADMLFDVAVSYRFDTRNALQAAVNRATADVQRLRAEQSSLSRDIRRSLDNVRSEAQAGAARLRSARSAVEANRENVAAAQDEFSIGRRSLLDLLEAQRDYIQAQATVIDAERQQVLTRYQALSLTGDIVEVFGIAFAELGAPDVPAAQAGQ